MQLIDTHVHVNFSTFESDLEATRDRWQAAGVVQLVHSCVTPDEYPSLAALADRFRELYFAVGLHPLEADRWTPELAHQLRQLAQSHPKIVAIGETGLDFYKADNRSQQQQAFWAQLEMAHALQKPVIIHCRDAAAALADQLRNFWDRIGEVRGVMHCWGGEPQETQWFLDLGFYISFSGTVTFKKATQIQESCQICPSDRLLIETDCPFLAPVPKRGKRNEPAYVRHVAEQVAHLRGVSLETLARQTTENARSLFGLPQLTLSDSPLLAQSWTKE
ncbi:TatD family hydrolase [Desertifilum sp. FACHB-1129]|uniref:D-aminoacyl-tRNA deacylase n=2 Tax=Cyanophyceae TaxID=3028117 RepID=A0A1E5QPU8_9CYAN|nr:MULTISPECIES: TatD family hydrolase [Cyanophyceae]MDA0209413.1 TatD family hydrolase [Cyanobacteria bacterium FC1]NES93668.1 TatD family hydrolase [Desertifilum sp. SIO1I2]MBD2311687.1 TatD family hydrolase [Desertifilum sp. FACHB-1129]MBD2322788.1 TatD family hydrolase [Desertifilum sp. FACHB-866]MBD2332818.1 TatD family hydrolase [Desertifilum sp. FACHB-868]